MARDNTIGGGKDNCFDFCEIDFKVNWIPILKYFFVHNLKTLIKIKIPLKYVKGSFDLNLI